MQTVSSEVKRFFEEFERLNSGAGIDTESMARLYSDTFMAADPNGAHAVPKAPFLAMLPKRKEMFALAGYASSTLTDIQERRLDDTYTLVDTKWIMRPIDPSHKQNLELSSSFILKRTANSFEIVFYLNHQDIVSKLQALG
ncbi:MAG TPA: hypothetical protein VFT53_02610 [Candidatus Saccharimonadales bacterium]|nr:hypothetical protein [Candidatus Saccharimonadales bacterium]